MIERTYKTAVFEYDFKVLMPDGKAKKIHYSYIANGTLILEDLMIYDKVFEDYPKWNSMEDHEIYKEMNKLFNELVSKYKTYLIDDFKDKAEKECIEINNPTEKKEKNK